MGGVRSLDTPVGAGFARVVPPERLPRLLVEPLLGRATTLGEHLDRYGALPSWGRDRSSRQELIELVHQSGLTGRGGASFPTDLKFAAIARQPGEPIVIANGTEGEPASSKDKLLLATSPHLVLDGAVLAALAVGAEEAIIVCHPAVREIVQAALTDRRRARQSSIRMRAVDAAERFVAGEASAVVHWLERGIPTPTRTPPRLTERGLHGRPTLLQNVETLAHLALIARHGAEWYRAVGTEAEPGSMLVTLLGAVRRPGVYEVAIGTRLLEVLDRAGGAIARPQAMLLGGYFGSWTGYDAAIERPFSRAGLAQLGAGPGAGLVAVLPSDACGLVETARVARYLASESAGQCGPCVFGLPAVASELESLASGGPFDRPKLERWLTQVDGRGACRHPDGVVRMVRSALATFRTELDRHERGRCCSPGVTGVLPVPGPRR
jgi:NADH:ubiquinone oxidoreductase subunit F (NADH-binding)